jgi:hypothetical protein
LLGGFAETSAALRFAAGAGEKPPTPASQRFLRASAQLARRLRGASTRGWGEGRRAL